MNRIFKRAFAPKAGRSFVLAALALAGAGSVLGDDAGDAMAYGGPGRMGGPAAMLASQDTGYAADMGLVHQLVMNHAQIRRSVTRLPDGIRTLTESDDPQVARAIQVHVASMSQRLEHGREFNLFSRTLPVLFAQRDSIVTKVEITATGAVVTQTSPEDQVVAALQAHAGEVSELVQEGHAAMRRGMMRGAGTGSYGMGMGMGSYGMGMARHGEAHGRGPGGGHGHGYGHGHGHGDGHGGGHPHGHGDHAGAGQQGQPDGRGY